MLCPIECLPHKSLKFQNLYNHKIKKTLIFDPNKYTQINHTLLYIKNPFLIIILFLSFLKLVNLDLWKLNPFIDFLNKLDNLSLVNK